MHLSAMGPKFFITIGFRPSGPAPLKEPILWNAFLIFLIVKVLSSLLFLTFDQTKLSTSGTSVWPGKNCSKRIDNDSSGLLQYSPWSFFNRPRALLVLLLNVLINLETSERLSISEVNLFQPSILAFAIADLYSLRRVLYAFLPSIDFFFSHETHFSSHFREIRVPPGGELVFAFTAVFLGMKFQVLSKPHR